MPPNNTNASASLGNKATQTTDHFALLLQAGGLSPTPPLGQPSGNESSPSTNVSERSGLFSDLSSVTAGRRASPQATQVSQRSQATIDDPDALVDSDDEGFGDKEERELADEDSLGDGEEDAAGFFQLDKEAEEAQMDRMMQQVTWGKDIGVEEEMDEERDTLAELVDLPERVQIPKIPATYKGQADLQLQRQDIPKFEEIDNPGRWNN